MRIFLQKADVFFRSEESFFWEIRSLWAERVEEMFEEVLEERADFR